MENNSFRIADECSFSQKQLLAWDYDPIAEGDVSHTCLESRYAGYARLDIAAAMRAILVTDGRHYWKWVGGIRCPKLYARCRNQFSMLPRILLETGAHIRRAPEILLDETPIQPAELINIEEGRRWPSIGDCLGLDPTT